MIVIREGSTIFMEVMREIIVTSKAKSFTLLLNTATGMRTLLTLTGASYLAFYTPLFDLGYFHTSFFQLNEARK